MQKTFYLALAVTLILALTFVSAEGVSPSTVGNLNAEIKLGGYGSVSGLKGGESVEFQTLTFQESQGQIIQIKKEALNINGKTIFPTYVLDEFNNKYVNFKIPENGNFNYEIIAEIQTSAFFTAINDYNITEPNADTNQFIRPSEKVENSSTEILTLVNSKFPWKNFLGLLDETISWVNGYVTYAHGSDFQRYYQLQLSAVETLKSREGVCDEFANLGAAILRARKIPTRLAIGITFDGEEWGNHAWIETYHTTAGWLSSDPTFREAGFVDAMHIKLGSFADVTQSVAKAIYPSTASVIFKTQPLPEVKINSMELFSQVDITSQTSEVKANQWNDIIVQVENKTSSTIIAPINATTTYKDLILESSIMESKIKAKKALILTPNTTSSIIFKVYPRINLGQNERAAGSIKFVSLGATTTQEVKILPSAAIDNGEVKVLDITPIATPSELSLWLKVANYSSKSADLNFSFQGEQDTNWKETIEAFTEKTYSKKIGAYTEIPYKVIALTPTEQYTQLIYPTKQTTIMPETPPETVVVQKIDSGKNNQKGQPIEPAPEFFVIIPLLVIAILLVIVFWSRKRYV